MIEDRLPLVDHRLWMVDFELATDRRVDTRTLSIQPSIAGGDRFIAPMKNPLREVDRWLFLIETWSAASQACTGPTGSWTTVDHASILLIQPSILPIQT